MTQRKLPSPEWTKKWVELQEQIRREFPAAVRGNGRFVIGCKPEKLPTGPDGTEMVQISVEVILGDRTVIITLVQEGFPDNGFAISIFSLFGVFRSYRMFEDRSIYPAVADVMAKVRQLIEEIKNGAVARNILQPT